jgi:signal transduction histidine kinase/CheY-like chemotaxis protein
LIESGGEQVAARHNAGLRERQPGIPAKFIVLALVAVLVIPGTLFASFLLWRYAEAERGRYEQQSITVASSAATVIDAELIGLQRTLQALSVSQYLIADDFEGFYRQAMAVKALIDADIGVRELNGQQVVNTRVVPGNKLPFTPFESDKTVVETGKPVITDVFVGAVAKTPLVAITVPVMRDGKVRYLLHISSDTQRFHDAVKSVTPDGWIIGVADRNGTYVTRSENHKDFTGKPGVAAYLARAVGQEGTFIGQSAFGDKVLVGYDHTRLSNWMVAANIPQSVIETPLINALYILAAFGAVALGLASLIGLWLWRFISRPLAQLAQAGHSLAEALPPPPLHTKLREFIAVHKALALAASQVRAGRRQLEDKVIERTQELQRANTELTEQMSAREQAESQLRQIQKMEAIGQLTGGIAHDFNNMLAIVISSLGLLKRRLDRGDTNVGKFVDSALDGARRAATLTSRLLAFSRQQPLAPEVLEINRLVAGMSDLLQRTIGQTVKIETVLAAGLWRAHADSAQLESAILNLCVNARDAMPEGGRLTIETSNAYLDDSYSVRESGVPAGQYVQVSVTDTGTGMGAEILARAFDPFFTTKRLGMGTGLGLSQVYGFVKQSHGHVKIYSEPGAGTTIKVYLPRFYGKDAASQIRTESREAVIGSPQDVILVVEDEENLRHLTVTTLRELGYTVMEAAGAREALAVIDNHPQIKLLFTDIVMPEVTGRVLADEAVKRRPDLRVLYTTGFTRNAVVHNGVLDAGVNFLPKPFSMESLGLKVREVLDAK